MAGIVDSDVARLSGRSAEGAKADLSRRSAEGAKAESTAFWSVPLPDLLSSLDTSPDGLETTQAERRLAEHGPNTLGAGTNGHVIRLLLRQFGSPIVLRLLARLGSAQFQRASLAPWPSS